MRLFTSCAGYGLALHLGPSSGGQPSGQMITAPLVSLAVAGHCLLSGHETIAASALLPLRSTFPCASVAGSAKTTVEIPRRDIWGRPQRLLRTSLGLDAHRPAFSSNLC